MRASKYYRKARYHNADGGISVRLISYSGVGQAVVYFNQPSPISSIPFMVGQRVTYTNGNTSLTGNISSIDYHDMGDYTTINLSYNGPAISGMDGGSLALAVDTASVPQDSFAAVANPVTWDSSNTIPSGYTAVVDSNGNTRLIPQTSDPVQIATLAAQHPDLPIAAILAPTVIPATTINQAPPVSSFNPPPMASAVQADNSGMILQSVQPDQAPAPVVDDSTQNSVTAALGDNSVSDTEMSSGMIVPSTQSQAQAPVKKTNYVPYIIVAAIIAIIIFKN
jgi:hypothetical protein